MLLAIRMINFELFFSILSLFFLRVALISFFNFKVENDRQKKKSHFLISIVVNSMDNSFDKISLNEIIRCFF